MSDAIKSPIEMLKVIVYEASRREDQLTTKTEECAEAILKKLGTREAVEWVRSRPGGSYVSNEDLPLKVMNESGWMQRFIKITINDELSLQFPFCVTMVTDGFMGRVDGKDYKITSGEEIASFCDAAIREIENMLRRKLCCPKLV